MAKTKPKRKSRRKPRHVPSDSIRAKVRVLALEGFSPEVIARAVEIALADLEKFYSKDLTEGPEDVAARLALRAHQEAWSGRDPVGARMIAGRLARNRDRRAQATAQAKTKEVTSRPNLGSARGWVFDADGKFVAPQVKLLCPNLGDPRWQKEVEERCLAAGEEGPISYYARMEREFAQQVAERTDPHGIVRLRPGERRDGCIVFNDDAPERLGN